MRCFFKKFLFSLLAGISLTGFSEDFHLKNGEVIKARLIREDQNNYYIQLPFGMTTLAKKTVDRVKQEQKFISPTEHFEDLCKNTASEKDCLEAADYGVKNNIFVPALLFLKRSLIRWNPDSKELKGKIASIEKIYVQDITAKIKNFYDAGHFRKAALTYEEAVSLYPPLAGFQEVQLYKNNLLSSLMTEEASLERVRFYINALPSFSSKEAVTAVPPAPDSAEKKPFESFFTEEKKFHTRFSTLLQMIAELLQHQDYILKHKMNEDMLKPIHSRKELDDSRGDSKKFNSLCRENNRIYKARSVLREYTQKLSSLKKESQRISKQMEEEAQEWKFKGYEKVNGQWLKGDDLKKARGMEFYKGQWLDPKDSDYEAQKARLDKPVESMISEPPAQINPVPSESPVAKKEEALGKPPLVTPSVKKEEMPAQATSIPSESFDKEENPSADQKMHADVKNVITTSKKEILSLRTAIILISILMVLWYFFKKTR